MPSLPQDVHPDRPAWLFVKEDPNERIRATARRHALEGSSHDTASRVAREAIQNSVDATLPDKKTEVLVRNMELSPKEAAAFRNRLGFDAEDSPIARLGQLGLSSPNDLTRLEAGQPVKVTVVEDQNTCGLGYDENDQKDRFEELCLSLGQDRTGVSTGKGGSYGLGKAVYEEASDCNMFVVYSVFEPSRYTDDHHARLFACATFDGHIWEGTKYTGRALFGIHEQRSPGQLECRPIVDDMAHEIAKAIGFRRSPASMGTSIMILGSSIGIDEFRTAVERWWWPRLLSNKLIVELWVGDDSVPVPDPHAVGTLEPYITCYTMIEYGVEPKSRRERKQSFRRFKGIQPGALALKALDDERRGPEDSASDSLFENTVALIRGGPLMVVEYMKMPLGGDRKCVGVFLGHSDADEALHLSEPPSHDTWNPNSQRLRDAYPDRPEKRKLLQEVVHSIVRRIENHCRKFLKELNPSRDPPVASGTRRLQQILASVMNAKKLDRPPPPPRHSDPFEIRIRERRVNLEATSAVEARVRIKLRSTALADRVNALVSIIPAVVLDDNMRREVSGRVPLASVSVDGEDVAISANEQGVAVDVCKGRDTVVDVSSESFNRDYYARLDVVVTSQSDGSATDGGRLQENGEPPS